MVLGGSALAEFALAEFPIQRAIIAPPKRPLARRRIIPPLVDIWHEDEFIPMWLLTDGEPMDD